jgi:hypothetical protein
MRHLTETGRDGREVGSDKWNLFYLKYSGSLLELLSSYTMRCYYVKCLVISINRLSSVYDGPLVIVIYFPRVYIFCMIKKLKLTFGQKVQGKCM